jgi:signal transduction histidine kinase
MLPTPTAPTKSEIAPRPRKRVFRAPAASALAVRAVEGRLTFTSFGLWGLAVAARYLGLDGHPSELYVRTQQSMVAQVQDLLGLKGPKDEIKELGDTFDSLLGRLEAAFQSQRRFVANASHELRTPLARQKAIIQVALADPKASAAALRKAHQRVLASGAEEERLIEALLTLARGQSGLDHRETLDVAAMTAEVLASRRSEARARRLEVRSELSPAPASGDPRLVERLVTNLVDNAVRHNVESGLVEISTATRDGRAVLRVANTGPQVPEAELDRLFQPFQRLAPERTGHGEGVGLGLSIVQAIAETHGAAITATPRLGGGMVVEVTFPMLGAQT